MDISELLKSHSNPAADRLLHQLQIKLAERLDCLWLVGGSIRDLLSGKSPHDFDIAFSGDLTPQIKAWAKSQAGTWFWLDKSRNQSRVIFSASGLQFDFSALRAGSICEDLELRDFTVNAMALSFLSASESALELIDPLNGREDLDHGILRSCSPQVLSDDPLRVLKGIRHFAEFGWSIEPGTAREMTAIAPCLVNVAGERIKSEMGQILDSERVVAAIELLSEHRILSTLLPGCACDGLKAQLRSLAQRLDQLRRIPLLRSILDRSIEEGISRQALLFFVTLLRRVPDLTQIESILRRFKFSSASSSILSSLSGPSITLEGFTEPASPRIAALKLEVLGRNCVEQMLFGLINHRNADCDWVVGQYIDAYYGRIENGQIINLLNGQAIISLTGLAPGCKLGEWQRKIKDAEIAGEITDKAGAEDWLKQRFYD